MSEERWRYVQRQRLAKSWRKAMRRYDGLLRGNYTHLAACMWVEANRIKAAIDALDEREA